MARLEGKVALVAGGGTGIGRATAELFAAEGASVVIFGRRPEPLAETVDAIRKAGGIASAVSGDVGSEADVSRFVGEARTEHGGVDVLVNSAAVRLRAPLLDISAADFAEVLRINLVGAFILTKTVAPLMRDRGHGSIIHIGSALGTVAAPDFSPYVASKGGLNQLARAAAVELVQDEIRVNVVAPGTIDTAIGMGVPEFRRHLLKHRIPIGRAGHVDDIALACLYLASDDSRYVTGAVIPVDGGWTAS
ncbi:MAG TPA: glucose 1-dehydrogenase [Candidatus Eisenbacteria bacterium]|nr:glucose 1-dehydrogenase [Candidatus Eisenbacteria bacterium]